jgi:hypothetical protein
MGWIVRSKGVDGFGEVLRLRLSILWCGCLSW